MDVLLPIVLLLALTGLIFSFLAKRRKKASMAGPLPETYCGTLAKQVPFYQQLNDSNKIEFEKRIEQFLKHVRITGVKTNIEKLKIGIIALAALAPTDAA